MTPKIIDFAAKSKEAFVPVVGSVLEVGSFDVNGSVRPVFEDSTCTNYIGIDISPGLRVDKILSGHNILEEFGPDSFDTVICCEMLEHDDAPWITVAQMREVLKPGGVLFVSTPTFGFPEHRYPIDCFRYGKDAYDRFIFKDMEIKRINIIHDDRGFPIICCLGRKPVLK